MTIWFVTPANGRLELSAVCFDQRLHVMATLQEHGIRTRCVVVADDGNLDLARDRKFDVVVQNNEWLGRRFNDGHESLVYLGADYEIKRGEG